MYTYPYTGGYPHQYIIQIKQSTSESWSINTTLSVDNQRLPSRQSVRVEDLKPMTDYFVRVQSQNINGYSEFTDTFEFSTNGELST